MKDLTRRTFLSTAAAGGGLSLFGSTLGLDRHPARGVDDTSPAVPAEFPSQPYALVREIVGAAHGRLERVEELVTARPALARAAHDWGFGDWESALGAASHMGRVDIAEILMAHGARANLFTLAMLGKVDAVKSFIESVPGIQRTPGPHGISLLQHARIGWTRSQVEGGDKVIDYLESLGDADPAALSLDVTPEDRASLVGKYVFGDGADEYFRITVGRGERLVLQRGERTLRVIHRIEPNAFAPSGAPAVRLRFERGDGHATSITVHDPMPIVKALYVEE